MVVGPKIEADAEFTEKTLFKQFKVETVLLGKGGFAEVRKLTRKKDGKTFALKSNPKDSKKSSESIEALKTEIDILKYLKHPHIIELKHYTITTKTIFLVHTLYLFYFLLFCVGFFTKFGVGFFIVFSEKKVKCEQIVKTHASLNYITILICNTNTLQKKGVGIL